MSHNNIFLKPVEFYQRQINPLGQYVEQSSFYLSKMTGRDIEHCKRFVTAGIKEGKFQGIVDPTVSYFERDENGDRHQHRISLSRYINTIVGDSQILAPTFTTYVNSEVKQSLLVDFVDGNVKKRSIAKKESQAAKAEGKLAIYVMKENEQANRKLYNNSLSGTFVAKGSVLNNPTAHSTLTSITRTVSSIGNASNEKIIAGNRHYRSPKVTLFNVISITNSLDREALEAVMQRYQLKYPTVEDVVDCIQFSSDLYWKDEKAFTKIYDFVCKLDPIERAGFVYCGDLYHIRKHNPEFIREFLTILSRKITDRQVDDPMGVIKSTDEQITNYVHQICMTETKGIGKDYKKLDPVTLNIIAATCLNVKEVIESNKDFINAIFLTRNVPASTAYIPDMIRRTVVLSDTDSTMFSVDDWVVWYFNRLIFTDEAFAIAGAVMFIATQCIAHNLAIFSANMNVKREKLFVLAMKPEFVFPVFAQTSVAKHYYTCIQVKEGNVYSEREMEIKGVWLKNSASPKVLNKEAHAKMKEILEKIISGEKISIKNELKAISDLERRISSSLLNGEVEFYKQSKIKNVEAYSRSAEESPYLYHLLWEEVFQPKYGPVDLPPYNVVKIPTTIENITGLKRWLEGIEDREMAERLGQWITKHNKKALPTMYLSTQFVKANGIPKELKSVINVKKIVLDLTITNRIILESLGYFPKSGWLISELGY